MRLVTVLLLVVGTLFGGLLGARQGLGVALILSALGAVAAVGCLAAIAAILSVVRLVRSPHQDDASRTDSDDEKIGVPPADRWRLGRVARLHHFTGFWSDREGPP